MHIAPKGDEELQQLAKDIVGERIFTTWQLPTEDIELFSMIFMSLSFMKRRELQILRSEAGLFYEYRYKALAKGINGYPCFLSAQWLTKADTITLRSYVTRLEREGG